jgi:hypothetical protein
MTQDVKRSMFGSLFRNRIIQARCTSVPTKLNVRRNVLDVHVSVHHDIIYENDQKMQLCRIIYYSLIALLVSSDIFAHHQEHLNCIIASGITHACRCRLVSWECGQSLRSLCPFSCFTSGSTQQIFISLSVRQNSHFTRISNTTTPVTCLQIGEEEELQLCIKPRHSQLHS